MALEGTGIVLQDDLMLEVEDANPDD